MFAKIDGFIEEEKEICKRVINQEKVEAKW